MIISEYINIKNIKIKFVFEKYNIKALKNKK